MRAAWAVLLLAGCAPAVVLDPIEVQVPVQVPCNTPPIDRPDWALAKCEDGERLLIRCGRAAMAELEQRRAYELLLEVAIEACRQGGKGEDQRLR